MGTYFGQISDTCVRWAPRALRMLHCSRRARPAARCRRSQRLQPHTRPRRSSVDRPGAPAACSEVVESADGYLFAGPLFNDYASVGYTLGVSGALQPC